MTAIFEDNFNSYDDGPLNGQGEWVGSDKLTIQASIKYEGAKAVKGEEEEYPHPAVFKVGATTIDGRFVIALRRDIDKTGAIDYVGFILDDINLNMAVQVLLRGDDIVYYSNDIQYTLLPDYELGKWYEIQVEWRSSDNKVRYKITGLTDWTDWVVRFFPDSAPLFAVSLDYNFASSGPIGYWDYIDEEPLALAPICRDLHFPRGILRGVAV